MMKDNRQQKCLHDEICASSLYLNVCVEDIADQAEWAVNEFAELVAKTYAK